jgi:predicted NACHT family NTPase
LFLHDSEDHRAARLLDIFVVPNVREIITAAAGQLEEALSMPPVAFTPAQAARWQEQQKQLAQDRGRSHSANQMLASGQGRVVLLGTPGTGKTTLMLYLAVKVALQEGAVVGVGTEVERLPILVYMREWAKQPERSLLEQVQDFTQSTLQVTVPAGFFEYWTDGRALLLLDGLDEVAEEATRAALVEKINCFLEGHPETIAVITSRPWGYRRDYFRTETYPHFELELFNAEQIQTFIQHWYANRCENATQTEEMGQDLHQVLSRHDRLQTLVKNPLLLTMVALIHRYQDTLPKRRHKLYERAVDTLLKSWDRKGKGATYGEFKHLDRDDDLRRVMSRLAEWIHTQPEIQLSESGTVIAETELIAQLKQIIGEECNQIRPQQAVGEAQRFVDFIQGRAGLLNEYGRGRYAFVHKTFQEYLTAEAILTQADYQDNSELIYQAIRDHLHAPHWREVLLLLVGQLRGQKAKKAIEVVLHHGSDYEPWLHRDLLFAGWCLTEDPEQLASAAPALVTEILQGLIRLQATPSNIIGEKVLASQEFW